MPDIFSINTHQEERTVPRRIAFAIMLYLVFDGFNHGMFDIQFTRGISLTAAALGLATLIILVEMLLSGRMPLHKPYALGAVLAVFAGYIYYSAWWSQGTYDLSFPKNLALFLLVVILCETGLDAVWILGTAAAAGLVQAMLGMMQISQLGGLPGGGVTGALPNHVQYAMYLLLSAIALLPFLLSRNRWVMLPAVAALALITGVMVLTMARGVFLTAAVVLVAAVLLLVKNRTSVFGWLGALLAGGLALIFTSDRLGTLLSLPMALGDTEKLNQLLSNRLPLYAAAWNMFRENPLLGIGYGSFPSVWVEYLPEGVGNVWMRELELATHSTYLQVLAETGLVGIGLYVAIIFLGTWYSLRAIYLFTPDRRTLLYSASVVAFLGILAITIHGTLDNTGWHDRVFYVYLALAAAMYGRALIRGDASA